MGSHDGDDDEATEEHTQLQRWGALTPPATAQRPRIAWTDLNGVHDHVLTERAVVGSAQKVGIVLADPMVSRIHAELELRDGGMWVRDLGSRNGTYIEGVMVGSGRVPDGGRIRLGSTELRVTYDDATVPAPELWPESNFGPLVGSSAPMRELFARLARVAATSSSVLIRGETGTGKELVARAIHAASRRAQGPLVVIDCGSLPEQLLEAELFGHARGAFTGAHQERVGAFEAAEGGTIFLDEIGEMPLSMQPKLLRVLESRTIRRVGETHVRPVDVRVLSATHRDLRKMVNGGAFREDLYFRLAVLPILVPPLRERADDLLLLVEHFLGAPTNDLSPALVAELRNRPWLGNVRELRNFVERAIAFGAKTALAMSTDKDSLRPPAPANVPAVGDPDLDVSVDFRAFREAWIEKGERLYVERMLASHAGVVTAASQAAGLDRTYFYKLMRRLGIQGGAKR